MVFCDFVADSYARPAAGDTTQPRLIMGPGLLCAGQTGNYRAVDSAALHWIWKHEGRVLHHAMGREISIKPDSSGAYTLLAVYPDHADTLMKTIEVRTQPPPPGEISGPAEVCMGLPLRYTSTPSPPGLITHWMADSGLIPGAASGLHADVVFLGHGPYTLAAWHAYSDLPTCPSDTVYHSLQVANPQPVIHGPDTVCPGAGYTFTTDYLYGLQYTWSVIPESAGSVVAGQGTRQVEILWNQPGQTMHATIRVRVKSCAFYYTAFHRVIIPATPAIHLLGDTIACAGDTVLLRINPEGDLPLQSRIRWMLDQGWAGEAGPQNVMHATDHQYEYRKPGHDQSGDFLQQFGTEFRLATPHFTGSDPLYIPVQVQISHAYGCAYLVEHRMVKVRINPVAQAYLRLHDDMGASRKQVELVTDEHAASAVTWFRNDSVLAFCDEVSLCSLQDAGISGVYFARVFGRYGCNAQTRYVHIDEKDASLPETCELEARDLPKVELIALDCGLYQIKLHESLYQFMIEPDFPAELSYTELGENEWLVQAPSSGLYKLRWMITTFDAGKPCTLKLEHELEVPYIPRFSYRVECASASNGYAITFQNHSQHFTARPAEIRLIKDGVDHATFTGKATVIAEPGLHHFRLETDYVWEGNLFTCTSEVTLPPLPELPHAAFDIPGGEYFCEDSPVSFINRSTPGKGLRYLWNFDHNAFNRVENPAKTYQYPGWYRIELIASNAVGCADTIYREISVLENTLSGMLDVSPFFMVCAGTEVNLELIHDHGFFPGGNGQLTWMNNLEEVKQSGVEPLVVHRSGTYWANMEDDTGCRNYTDQVPVIILDMPAIQINGDREAQSGTAFTLCADAGGTHNRTYRWYKNGTFFKETSRPCISITETVQGTARFTVEEVFLLFEIECTSRSDEFEVRVGG